MIELMLNEELSEEKLILRICLFLECSVSETYYCKNALFCIVLSK